MKGWFYLDCLWQQRWGISKCLSNVFHFLQIILSKGLRWWCNSHTKPNIDNACDHVISTSQGLGSQKQLLNNTTSTLIQKCRFHQQNKHIKRWVSPSQSFKQTHLTRVDNDTVCVSPVVSALSPGPCTPLASPHHQRLPSVSWRTGLVILISPRTRMDLFV